MFLLTRRRSMFVLALIGLVTGFGPTPLGAVMRETPTDNVAGLLVCIGIVLACSAGVLVLLLHDPVRDRT